MAIVELLGSEPDFNKAPEKKKTMGGRIADRIRGKKADASPEGPDAPEKGAEAAGPEAGGGKKARAPRKKK